MHDPPSNHSVDELPIEDPDIWNGSKEHALNQPLINNANLEHDALNGSNDHFPSANGDALQELNRFTEKKPSKRFLPSTYKVPRRVVSRMKMPREVEKRDEIDHLID